jgi:hypothetical protein
MVPAFTKKQKWLCIASVLVCLILYRYISVTQTVNLHVAKMSSSDHSVRLRAINDLAHMGSSASGATEELSNAVQDYDSSIRSASTQALLQIDRSAAVDALIEAYASRDTAIRIDAAEALERIGTPKALAAVQGAARSTHARYERTQMRGWVNDMRREYENKKKKEYRAHKRKYGR